MHWIFAFGLSLVLFGVKAAYSPWTSSRIDSYHFAELCTALKADGRKGDITDEKFIVNFCPDRFDEDEVHTAYCFLYDTRGLPEYDVDDGTDKRCWVPYVGEPIYKAKISNNRQTIKFQLESYNWTLTCGDAAYIENHDIQNKSIDVVVQCGDGSGSNTPRPADPEDNNDIEFEVKFGIPKVIWKSKRPDETFRDLIDRWCYYLNGCKRVVIRMKSYKTYDPNPDDEDDGETTLIPRVIIARARESFNILSTAADPETTGALFNALWEALANEEPELMNAMNDILPGFTIESLPEMILDGDDDSSSSSEDLSSSSSDNNDNDGSSSSSSSEDLSSSSSDNNDNDGSSSSSSSEDLSSSSSDNNDNDGSSSSQEPDDEDLSSAHAVAPAAAAIAAVVMAAIVVF